MKHPTKLLAFAVLTGALLTIGLVATGPSTASAETFYDAGCKCEKPVAEYDTRKVVRAPVKVKTRTRYVDHTREVKRTKMIQENRTVLHIQPVINREVVIHRENTVIRNITLHRLRTINKTQRVYRDETVHRYVKGTTRVVNERVEVPENFDGRSQKVTFR
ncbi:MAG: hypothetical protein GC182_17850 [Rhodopseudomonas sp.]|nr:hypothetical protein [Rhodopseudomonas sp.]